MRTLHESKAEWGIFHMLVAQTVLKRPIHLALPLESAPYWHIEPITEIVRRYVFEAKIDIPEAPNGEPLRLLPTRMNQVDVANWSSAVKTAPSMYGSSEEKDAFLDRELKEMEQRSRAWGKQAVSLRESLGLQPARVHADGACGLSSLSVAASGTASDKEKEALRAEVRNAAPQILDDVRFQKLRFILEGEPARVRASGRQPAQGQSLLGGSACEIEGPCLGHRQLPAT